MSFDERLSRSKCYGYKIGHGSDTGILKDQMNATFQNSVVYVAALGVGIDHWFGTVAAIHIAWPFTT